MLSKSQVKYIQSLGHKKFRNEAGLFLAEGPRIVEELLAGARPMVQQVYGLGAWIAAHQALLGEVPCLEISAGELDRISQLTAPNQVLALVKQPDQPDRDAAAGTVTLVLDDIQDPGNLGTMLRIADWFDVDLVVCSRDCADRFNPKVVQATMGSILRVPAFYTDLLPWLNRQTVRTYAAVLEGRDVTRMEKLTEGIILIGNESRGIRPDLLSASQVRITIPRKGRAESLNAAVAAGIILSHLT